MGGEGQKTVLHTAQLLKGRVGNLETMQMFAQLFAGTFQFALSCLGQSVLPLEFVQ